MHVNDDLKFRFAKSEATGMQGEGWPKKQGHSCILLHNDPPYRHTAGADRSGEGICHYRRHRVECGCGELAEQGAGNRDAEDRLRNSDRRSSRWSALRARYRKKG